MKPQMIYAVILWLASLMVASPGVAPSYMVARNADKYRLVFATDYQGRRFYRLDKSADSVALVQATRSELDNFVIQLNQEGTQGYRVISAIYNGLAVAILEFDGDQHEYAWIMPDSILSALSGKDDDYERLAKRGFRLVQHFEIITYCPDYGENSTPGGDSCQTRHVLLLEKEKGVEKATPYALIYPTGDWRGPLKAWLTDQIKEKLSEGFSPTHLISEYGILVEQIGKKDERSTRMQDMQVLEASKYWSADHSKSRINELAKRGYRLAFLNNRIALMKKDGDTTTPVTYLWLHTTTKKNWKLEPRKRGDFEAKLANLQASGAVYRMVYEDSQGYSKLIFEQNSLGRGPRREYKMLTFDFQVNIDAASQKITTDLTPASKETLKLLNSLSEDRFVVRDLFAAEKTSVVLERTP